MVFLWYSHFLSPLINQLGLHPQNQYLRGKKTLVYRWWSRSSGGHQSSCHSSIYSFRGLKCGLYTVIEAVGAQMNKEVLLKIDYNLFERNFHLKVETSFKLQDEYSSWKKKFLMLHKASFTCRRGTQSYRKKNET